MRQVSYESSLCFSISIDVKIEELHWRSTKLIKNQHSHQKIIIYIFLVLRDTESRSGLFLHRDAGVLL